jgi:hypothetical protein
MTQTFKGVTEESAVAEAEMENIPPQQAAGELDGEDGEALRQARELPAAQAYRYSGFNAVQAFEIQPEHLRDMPQRVKNPRTQQWETRVQKYLDVKWRLLKMRTEHPDWAIRTAVVQLDLEKEACLARCEIVVPIALPARGVQEYVLASDYGFETKAGFGDYIQKAITNAIGRALATAGYGTQFATELDIEDGREAAGRYPGVDAGVEAKKPSPLAEQAVKLGARPVLAGGGDALPSDRLVYKPEEVSLVQWAQAISGFAEEVGDDQPRALNATKFVAAWKQRDPELAAFARIFGGTKLANIRDYLVAQRGEPLGRLLEQLPQG